LKNYQDVLLSYQGITMKLHTSGSAGFLLILFFGLWGLLIFGMGGQQAESENTGPENSNYDTEVLGIEWIRVTPGKVKMGSEERFEEKPVHEVSVDGFYISRYEITHLQYIIFLNSVQTDTRGSQEGKLLINTRDRASPVDFRDSYFFRGSKYASSPDTPVVNVTWTGAGEFCRWLSEKTGKYIHLPTEAQWEYAARGGEQSGGFLYSGSDDFQKVGWCVVNSGLQLQPVGTKQPNELGIYDMSGNAAEWCSDYFKPYYDFEWMPQNPTGPSEGSRNVIRGGGWNNGAFALRNAYRTGQVPGHYSVNLGFRIIMDR
jgi:formylglycine-generating enzyme required for sulfatase activity